MHAPAYRHPDQIVSTGWLAEHLQDPALRIYDCTTYLDHEAGADSPYRVISGRADYDAGHIPGSAFLDLQGTLSAKDSPFRFTMPPITDFAAAAGRQGIGEGVRVILYARKTNQWATRIWWMLHAAGFDDAAILDGGWDKWALEGRPASTTPATYPPATFMPHPRLRVFAGRDEVRDAIADEGVCTLNALATDLHSGQNPRYGRPGRIPGSVNVPASTLLDPKDRTFVPPVEAAAAFAGCGAAPEKRTIVYCGGGIAATLDAFLLHQLGYEDIAVYDNSMSEWATDESLPIETD